MRTLFLTLFGRLYVVKANMKGNVHRLSCKYGQMIKGKKYLTTAQFKKIIKNENVDGCCFCNLEYSKNNVGAPRHEQA